MTLLTEDLIPGLLRTTLSLSLAALIGGLVLRVFRVQSPRTHRIVWLAVLVQGCLFFTIELPLLPERQVPAVVTPQPSLPAEEPFHFEFPSLLFDDSTTESVVPTVSANTTAAHPEYESPGAPEFSWASLFLMVWVSGMVLIVLRFLRRYVQFLRELSHSSLPSLDWASEWLQTRQELGITKEIPLWIHSAGPLLCRTPRSFRLLVPAELWETLTLSQRRSIFWHELAHYQRGDIWKSLLVRVLLLPQWFNPLAWFSLRRFDEAAEWACDDAVSQRSAEHTPEYARTLLELATEETVTTAWCPGVGGHSLADRIRRLLNPLRKEESTMKRLSLLTLVTGLSLLGLFRVGTADAQNQSTELPSEPVTVVAPPTSPQTKSGQLTEVPHSSPQTSPPAQPPVTPPNNLTITVTPRVIIEEAEEELLLDFALQPKTTTNRQQPQPAKTPNSNISNRPQASPNQFQNHPMPAKTPNKTAGQSPVISNIPRYNKLFVNSQQQRHVYKIDEAVLDLASLFKNLPEFTRQQKELKKAAAEAEASLRVQVVALQKLQQEAKRNPEQAQKQLIQLKVEIESSRARMKQRLLEQESRLYQETYAKIQRAVATYAKEKDIRRVTLQKPVAEGKLDHAAVIQRLNQNVIYEADERPDITDEILKRLTENKGLTPPPTPAEVP